MFFLIRFGKIKRENIPSIVFDKYKSGFFFIFKKGARKSNGTSQFANCIADIFK